MKIINDQFDKDRKLTPDQRWRRRRKVVMQKKLYLTFKQILFCEDKARLRRLIHIEARKAARNEPYLVALRTRLAILQKPYNPWADFTPADITKHLSDFELKVLIKKNLKTLPSFGVLDTR